MRYEIKWKEILRLYFKAFWKWVVKLIETGKGRWVKNQALSCNCEDTTVKTEDFFQN